MGLFSSPAKKLNWIELESIQQFDEYYNSGEQIVVFKHSTRCSISAFALKNFEREYATSNPSKLLFLDLIKYREISNHIAEKTGIRHESPQVLSLSHQKVRYNASHEQINANHLNATL